jgi:hypothetical protein
MAALMLLGAHHMRYDQLLGLQFPGLLNVNGRQLKDTLTFQGTMIVWPKNGDADVVTQALLSGHLRNTPIDWDGIVLPAALPNNAAGLADWWRDSGIVMIQRWHHVIKVDRDVAHAHVRSSRALKMEELPLKWALKRLQILSLRRYFVRGTMVFTWVNPVP